MIYTDWGARPIAKDSQWHRLYAISLPKEWRTDKWNAMQAGRQHLFQQLVAADPANVMKEAGLNFIIRPFNPDGSLSKAADFLSEYSPYDPDWDRWAQKRPLFGGQLMVSGRYGGFQFSYYWGHHADAKPFARAVRNCMGYPFAYAYKGEIFFRDVDGNKARGPDSPYYDVWGRFMYLHLPIELEPCAYLKTFL